MARKAMDSHRNAIKCPTPSRAPQTECMDTKTLSDGETLQSLVDDIPGGFARFSIKDGEATPLFFSKGFQKLIGLDDTAVSQSYNLDVLERVHPDDADVAGEALKKLFSTGSVSGAYFRIRRADGVYRFVTFAGHRTRDKAGKDYIDLYYLDGTEQHEAEQRQMDLLDRLPCGAGLFSYDGKSISAIYINKRYWELVMRLPGNYRGSSLMNAVHPEDWDGIAQTLTDAIRQARDFSGNARLLYGHGDYRPFHIMGRILPDRNGRYTIYASFTRITNMAMSYEDMLPVLLSTLMESSSDLTYAKDKDLRYICCSSAFARTFGLKDASDAIGKTDDELFTPEIIEKFRPDDRSVITTGQSVIDKIELIPSADAIPHYSKTSKYALRDAYGNIVGLYGLGRDITAYRDAFEKLRLLTESIPGGIATFEVSPRGAHMLYFNEGFYRSSGYSREEYKALSANNPLFQIFEQDVPEAMAAISALKPGVKETSAGIYRCHTKSGGYRWFSLSGTIAEAHGDTFTVNVVKYDITDQKEKETQIKEMAETDVLTGVLNRHAFTKKMEELLANRSEFSLGALFMLDLDGFKLVNDSFGHAVGDQTLIEIAQTLRAIFREGDLIGRLGGDEFLIFLNNLPSRTIIHKKATQICAQLRKSFSLEVQLSTSVGVAICPDDGDSFDILYKKADLALYHVKAIGKNSYSLYKSEMGDNEPRPAASGTQDTLQVLTAAPKRRMLIIEDNKINSSFLVNLFKDEFIVDTADDGHAALIRLRRYGAGISIVLLDLMLPGMDGFAVLEKMRKQLETQSIPVIVVSAMDEREISLKAIQYGASDYITKPVDAALLRLRVQSALSKAENERLRAQNRYLALQSDAVSACRAALEDVGVLLIRYDEASEAFLYDSNMAHTIAGNYDERSLWNVLLDDGVADSETVKAMREAFDEVLSGTRLSRTMTAVLKMTDGTAGVRRVKCMRQAENSPQSRQIMITLTAVPEGDVHTQTER